MAVNSTINGSSGNCVPTSMGVPCHALPPMVAFQLIASFRIDAKMKIESSDDSVQHQVQKIRL